MKTKRGVKQQDGQRQIRERHMMTGHGGRKAKGKVCKERKKKNKR